MERGLHIKIFSEKEAKEKRVSSSTLAFVSSKSVVLLQIGMKIIDLNEAKFNLDFFRFTFHNELHHIIVNNANRDCSYKNLENNETCVIPIINMNNVASYKLFHELENKINLVDDRVTQLGKLYQEYKVKKLFSGLTKDEKRLIYKNIKHLQGNEHSDKPFFSHELLKSLTNKEDDIFLSLFNNKKYILHNIIANQAIIYNFSKKSNIKLDSRLSDVIYLLKKKHINHKLMKSN